jgi:prephenate dehydrogenase
MKTLGIVGLGNFGRLVARRLSPHFEVIGYDASDVRRLAAEAGVKPGTLADAAACGIVVLAVPVDRMESVLRDMKPYVRPGTLVLDVASVKEKPVRIMTEILPPEVEIIGTHPLFGPGSAGSESCNETIVLCPVRTDRLASVRYFLEDTLGLSVVIDEPRAHDRHMANVQALSHFIAKAIGAMKIQSPPYTTCSFDRLASMVSMVNDGSAGLFDTIENENAFAFGAREALLAELARIHAGLESPESRPV